MRALLAEDDEKLGRLVKNFLEEENFSADWVKSGAEALYYASNAEYDIVILDWMMPDGEGIDVCRKLREQKVQTGILMLTARDTVEDRVVGLDAGADDYLVKPFAFAELMARIRSVLRRSEQKFQEELLQVGTLCVNRSNGQAWRKGQELELTNREYQLLEILLINAGNTVTRDQLLDRIWGMEGDVMPNTLEVYINYLRRKLDLPGQPSFIKTIRGVGYRLELQDV